MVLLSSPSLHHSVINFFYVLFYAALCASADLRLDGGNNNGWNTDEWRVQVDGVMGGQSDGKLRFVNNDKTMVFTGEIVTYGGGFSSVRRDFDGSIDLQSYAGIVVEVEPLEYVGETQTPLALHLQLHDSKSYYGYSAAFAIPLASSSSNSREKIFIPLDEFSRASNRGRPCNGCKLDTSSINGMDIYVLYQEGGFEVRVHSIKAVDAVQAFEISADVISNSNNNDDDIVQLIQSTINSGSYVWGKKYKELCTAMYWSTVNTIVASASSSSQSNSLKNVACAGLAEATKSRKDKSSVAWTLRYTMDAILADLQGQNRDSNLNNLDWLPLENAPVTTGDDYCIGITSMVPNDYYVAMDTSTGEGEVEVEEETAERLTNQQNNVRTSPPTEPPADQQAGWFWSWWNNN